MTMPSRQRVAAAISCRTVDAVPARLNCPPNGVAQAVARELGLSLEGDWFERLHRRLRIDMRIIDPEVDSGDYAGDNLNLVDAVTAADVERLWPAKWKAENRTIEPARRKIAEWDSSGNPPAVQVRLPALFGMHARMRGQEAAFADLADESAVLEAVMDGMERFCHAMIDKAFDTLGDRLDMIYLADELGMQTGLMFSPASIRKHLLPRFERLFARVHARGGKVFYHSCGAIEPLIGDLLDAGVDVLNPIQPGLPGMEPENLRRYAGRVCFCGGLDMQHLLPKGSPQEIRDEVARYIRCLGPGYMIDSANILHDDIPPRNAVALYEAPRDLKREC